MSGRVSMPAPAGRAAQPRPGPRDEPLFTAVAPRPRGKRVWLLINVSIALHVVLVGAMVLGPLYWPEPMPPEQDLIRLLVYNPPPPPPPPPPRGTSPIRDLKPAQPVTPQIQPDKFTAPKDVIDNKDPKEARPPEITQEGLMEGSDAGMPEGMEGGVEGGVPGGVPGGVLGGVIGGTGDSPVQDWDQPPRCIRCDKPQYPQEGFVKKIEGVVQLEILIDASGRVANARVVKSIPLLDAAAIQCVKQWVFAPAVKHGRPVATIASAPVNFRIY